MILVFQDHVVEFELSFELLFLGGLGGSSGIFSWESGILHESLH